MFRTLINALQETLYMVLCAGGVSMLIGIPFGILIARMAHSRSSFVHSIYFLFYGLLKFSSAIPYLLIMLIFIPMTNWLINKNFTYTTATILPLATAGSLFLAQSVYNTIGELLNKWHSTSKTMGATTQQTLILILLPEAFWPIIRASAETCSLMVGFTVVAGALGAGGLGQLAIEKSINKPNALVVIICIVALVAIQQFIKYTGVLATQQNKI